MSQTEPPAKKAKTSASAQQSQLPILHDIKYAVSADKGSRQYMEDVWVANQLAGEDAGFDCRLQYFAVFDGHGGKDSATYAASNLHSTVVKAGLAPGKVLKDGKLDVKGAKKAVAQGFLDTDAAILKEGEAAKLKALTLTKEHLALYPAERARIEKQGGFVSKDGRLNGRIQVSRGFGDAHFKQSGCTATPDITAFQLTENDRFLICACDGFWRVFDAQGAVDLMEQLFAEGRDEKAAANRILNEAVRERKCHDNCTVMVVRFHRRGARQAAAVEERRKGEGTQQQQQQQEHGLEGRQDKEGEQEQQQMGGPVEQEQEAKHS